MELAVNKNIIVKLKKNVLFYSQNIYQDIAKH